MGCAAVEAFIGFGAGSAIGTLTAHLSDSSSSWLHLQLPPNLDQTIGLVCSPRPFGGLQWYMLCPFSGHRASVLYRPQKRSAVREPEILAPPLRLRLAVPDGDRSGPSQHPPHRGQALASEPQWHRRRLLLPGQEACGRRPSSACGPNSTATRTSWTSAWSGSLPASCDGRDSQQISIRLGQTIKSSR